MGLLNFFPVSSFGSGLVVLLLSTSALAGDPAQAAASGTNPQTWQEAREARVSNYEFIRFGLGGWYLTGQYSPEFNKTARYTGGGGGILANLGAAMNRYLVVDFNFRIGGSGYGDKPRPDLEAQVSWGFSGARWSGKMPGSFVFGGGAGASVGRPIWVGSTASVHPTVSGRFMVKFSSKVRLQLDYRFSPVSSQLYFSDAWVMAHDGAVILDYDWLAFGASGRIENIKLGPEYAQNLQSFWIGGYLGLVYK